MTARFERDSFVETGLNDLGFDGRDSRCLPEEASFHPRLFSFKVVVNEMLLS